MSDDFKDWDFDQETELEKTIVRPMKAKPREPELPEFTEPPEPPKNRVPLKKIVLGLLIAAALLALALFFFRLGANTPAPEPKPDPAPAGPVEPEGPFYHPLTGVQIAEAPSGRMYCVSVDNSPEARPQSGVEAASLVYELPAEAHIPRLLLCYYNVNADVIGPVRSARPYIVDSARGWGGFFAHCGWSPEAEALLESGVVDYVNEIDYHDYFWRDDSRDAPHNLYTSTDLLAQAVDDFDYAEEQEVPSFSFRRDGELLAGEDGSRLDIEFEAESASFVYDEARRAYGRWVNGYEYKDSYTGNQVFASNVIVQFVGSRVLDEEGRLELDLTSGGDALLFTNGVLIRGSWTRSSLDEPTRFVDENGEDFSLLPGQTWIEIVDEADRVSY